MYMYTYRGVHGSWRRSYTIFNRYRGGGRERSSSSLSHSSLAKELRARFSRYRGGSAPPVYHTVHWRRSCARDSIDTAGEREIL